MGLAHLGACQRDVGPPACSVGFGFFGLKLGQRVLMTVKVWVEGPSGEITIVDEADGLTGNECRRRRWIEESLFSRFDLDGTLLVADLGSVAEQHPQEIVQMMVQSDVEASLAEHIKQVPGIFLSFVASDVFHQIIWRPSVC
jgi:hypothetical protein